MIRTVQSSEQKSFFLANRIRVRFTYRKPQANQILFPIRQCSEKQRITRNCFSRKVKLNIKEVRTKYIVKQLLTCKNYTADIV